MKKRFSGDQIVGFLREAQLGAKTVEQLSKEHGFSQNSFYVWKRKFGAMAEPDVKQLRELEKENGRLKRLLAERDVEIDVMKEILEKNCRRRGAAEAGGVLRASRRIGVASVRVGRREPTAIAVCLKEDDSELAERLMGLGQGASAVRVTAVVQDAASVGRVNLKRIRRLVIPTLLIGWPRIVITLAVDQPPKIMGNKRLLANYGTDILIHDQHFHPLVRSGNQGFLSVNYLKGPRLNRGQ